jgi:hypothetical protein
MDDATMLELTNIKSALSNHIAQNVRKFSEYDTLVSNFLSKGNIMADTTTPNDVRIHNHAPAPTDTSTAMMPALMAAMSKPGSDGLLGGGGGILGGLLLGTLLRNGGLFGNGGDTTAMTQPTANMSIMSSLGDIKQAIAVNGANMETSNANQTIATMGAINASTGATQIAVGGLKDVVNSNAVAMMQMFNGVTTAISSDGEKTRALITSQYEATLNRQLSDANAAIIELRGDQRLTAASRATEVNVNTNVNQMQQQQQQQVLLDRVNQVLAAHQYLQQGIVNLGTMSGSAGSQTAANTRVN